MKTQFQRLDIHQRIQHFLIMFSFMICTLTGLPIKFSHFPWAKNIAGIYGGFDNMFLFHLLGATIMLLSCVYHLMYLPLDALKRGKLATAMLPAVSDFINLADNIKYFLGLREKPAYFDRYTYFEKFDYWAVFWGMIMIGLTGLMMWFPDIAAAYVPRYIIDIGRIAHSDEAVLAIIVIFVWHFFNVHMNPKYYPMNSAWFDGKISVHHFKLEHPAEYDRVMATKRYQTVKVATKKEDAAL